MSRRRRPSQPEEIRDLVPKVLHDLGLDQTARVMRIAAGWEATVGPEIARHCRPTAIRGEVLEASVDSSVWCQQLRFRTPEILDALRRDFGDEAPGEIRLSVRAPLG